MSIRDGELYGASADERRSNFTPNDLNIVIDGIHRLQIIGLIEEISTGEDGPDALARPLPILPQTGDSGVALELLNTAA